MSDIAGVHPLASYARDVRKRAFVMRSPATRRRRLSRHEQDSDALNQIYLIALDDLEQRHNIQDVCKTKLVAIIIKTYFVELKNSAVDDVEAIAAMVVFRYKALLYIGDDAISGHSSIVDEGLPGGRVIQ